MGKFTNQNVLKEKKKLIRNLIISIIIIAFSVVCYLFANSKIDDVTKDVNSLHSVIISDEDSIEDKKAYIDVSYKPYKFAIYEDTTDSYYIVMDDDYMYVVYMSVSDFYKLNKNDIEENHIRIEGITKPTTRDIKELAIDAYNEAMDDQNNVLSLADYDNYFGSVHLDLTVSDNSVATIPLLLFFISWLCGFIYFVASVIGIVRFNRSIKKLGEFEISDLDKEMNAKEAFYYEKTHMYLTDKYIIKMDGVFKVIKYSDILWMYPFIQRTNGVKTNQSIRILVNDGKTYTIASVTGLTKASKAVYNEIWDTIISKNDKMKVGYTSENIKEMNKKIKEIKKEKKMNRVK